MNISYNWLKRYLATDLSAEEIARILTDIGLEVEGFEKIETIRGGLQGVVVGEVLTCVDHPDSDHLHVTTVDVGSGEPLQIVCGAANCRAGLKVMCATVGSVLYPTGSDEEFKIKRSKIRGVESLGMLCAEDELGIGTDHAGIMELPQEAPVGMTAKEYLHIEDDFLIEIGLTPNRVDAASHIGVARDLAAYLRARGEQAEVRWPDVSAFAPDNRDLAVPVRVECPEAAPRYAGVTVRGCKIGPSPDWMQNCLRAIGLNPKNNVVDITNFVLHELGQPLHSFDADRIAGGRVVVKTCAEGTKFVTLDGVERTLSERDLMICDAEKPMCIAGVMGGRDSGVSDATVNVFLESAYFNPVWIRKSARRHGINSDASFRFERGIDPNITIYALKRAALLIQELAGGRITSGIADTVSVPDITEPFRFDVGYDRINALTGNEIPQATVKEILGALEVRIEAERDGVLSVAVPPYRVDVRRPADLTEEILRIYGYNNIEVPARVRSAIALEKRPGREQIANRTAEYLTANGFSEIMSNSLTKLAYYEGLTEYPADGCVKILNPLSADLNAMRQTLLFNAMEAVALNTNHRNPNLKLYEFGNVYRYDASRAAEGGLAPYSENYRLGVVMTGLTETVSWNEKAAPATFFSLRAVAENLLGRFGMDIYRLETLPLGGELYSEGLSFRLNGKELFSLGIVAGSIRKMFDLRAEVYFLEMDFDLFVRSVRKHTVAVSELPRFPEVRRDLALLLDREVTFARLRAIAFSTERKLLRSVTLFDVYEGDKLPAGKKSYALGFVLQDRERTLTDQIIDRVMNNLLVQFEKQAGAVVRV